ncbi:hypothetical protein ALC62_08904 [Cyphomyrmex costatus]|uniref:Uncharacterized protein n=1 Tax=Cyphomyrmex costatus TaxID=456900 RepID=A0A195CJ02_9HYME|nr:hypothetical protein ALC62_08904 [Cyphomyrmex costatus]
MKEQSKINRKIVKDLEKHIDARKVDLPTQCCIRLAHRNTYYLPDFTNAVVPFKDGTSYFRTVTSMRFREEGSHARPADIGRHPLCSPMYQRPSFTGIDGLRPASSVREGAYYYCTRLIEGVYKNNGSTYVKYEI